MQRTADGNRMLKCRKCGRSAEGKRQRTEDAKTHAGLQRHRRRRRPCLNFVRIVGKPSFLSVAVSKTRTLQLNVAVKALYIFCSFPSNKRTGNCSNCHKGAIECDQSELLLGGGWV